MITFKEMANYIIKNAPAFADTLAITLNYEIYSVIETGIEERAVEKNLFHFPKP